MSSLLLGGSALSSSSLLSNSPGVSDSHGADHSSSVGSQSGHSISEGTYSVFVVIAEAVLDDAADWVTEGSVVAVFPAIGSSVRESSSGTVSDGTTAEAHTGSTSGVLTTALSPVGTSDSV